MSRCRVLSHVVLAGLLSPAPIHSQEAAKRPPVVAVVAEIVEPMVFRWKEAYQARTPGFSLECTSTLQDKVFQAFLEGRTPIAPSARDLTPEEVSAWTVKWGYAPIRLAMAMDALVVLVHKSNPIKEIRMEQIDAIYSSTRLMGSSRDVATWGDLGLAAGNWPGRPIVIYGHPEGSGTLDFFRRVMPGKPKPNIRRGADILAMVEELTANQAAIGYGSVSQSFTSLRMVPVVPLGGKSAVEPSSGNIADGSYPLGRVLNLYVNKVPGKPLDAPLLGFIRFALSAEGQALVRAAGFVPLPEDIASVNLRRLESAR